MCKLEHSLISIPDIVQEKMLFVYLLEWFNFPEVPMQEEVLDLLLTLSQVERGGHFLRLSFCHCFLFLSLVCLVFKHPSAAQMLRDVEAEDFLSQLSANVEPRLRAVIDATLDQLFQLPELIPGCTPAFTQGLPNKPPTGAAGFDKLFMKSIQ